MSDRVLISCKHVWDVFDRHAPRFERLGIAVDMPKFEGQQLEEPDLLPIIGQYSGVLAGDDHLTAAVIQRAAKLKVIAKWGIGIDAIDTEAAASHGVVVLNTPGVFGDELGDYALGYLLLLARQQHRVHDAAKRGEWLQIRGRSLRGLTLGIFGLGSSGRAFARRAAVMGLRVLGVDIQHPGDAFLQETGCEFVSLEEMLDRADVISLHAPAAPGTAALIDERAINAMKPGVWLINIARGALVDEMALVAGLRSGAIGAAALDVFENEPLPADSPLRRFENVVLGSHNGSNTAEAVDRTTERAIDNLFRGLGINDG